MARSKYEKTAFALLSDYVCLYKNRYGVPPLVNKYKEKWAMISLVEDFGAEDVANSLEYYFKTIKEGHPLNYFYNNFSSIHSSRISAERDNRIRAEQRKMTEKLRAEYFNGIQ